MPQKRKRISRQSRKKGQQNMTNLVDNCILIPLYYNLTILFQGISFS